MSLMPIEAKDNPIGNLQDDADDYEELDGNLLNEDFGDNKHQR